MAEAKRDVLGYRVDFVAVVDARDCNPNGDPLRDNMPRQDYEGFGVMSQECIKRKMRNAMQRAGAKIFIQSDGMEEDSFTSLKARADGNEALKKAGTGKSVNKELYKKIACEQWADVRAFGQVFAFSDKTSVSVKGPVTVHPAISVDPILIQTYQITKSVNSEPKKDKEGEETEGMSSDRMGHRHITSGVYIIKGSISAQLANKTGFTVADAEMIKEALRTLFVGDESSARPAGSMALVKLFWFEHKNTVPSTRKVHNSVKVTALKENPRTIDDYSIEYVPFEGCSAPEIIEGE